MAVLILALVVAIITGAHYFGRNVTRPVWLVRQVCGWYSSVVHCFGAGVTLGINRLPYPWD
jgi:hypothetical protein